MLSPLRVEGPRLTPEQLATFWRWLDEHPGAFIKVQDDEHVRIHAVGCDVMKFPSVEHALAYVGH